MHVLKSIQTKINEKKRIKKLIDNRFLLIFVNNFIVNLNFFSTFFVHLIFNIVLTFNFNLTFFTNLFFLFNCSKTIFYFTIMSRAMFFRKKNLIIHFALISTLFLFLFSINVIDDVIQINRIILCRITKN